MNYEIIKVHKSNEIKRFIDFPHDLYKGDPNYVPEIYLAQKDLLSKKKNPFFQHSIADLFLAVQDGKIVGRIAAIHNKNYNNYHDSNIGFFGFFDCINDQEVANLLLDKVSSWIRERGLDELHGPTNFTTNETAGLLVEGFDSPPVVQLTYNKKYYLDLLSSYGFQKEMDMYAYFIPTFGVNEKALKMANLLKERLKKRKITFRNITKKSMKEDLAKIKIIYRSAWEKNWGFVPPTDAEFDHLVEGLKLLIDTRFVYIAEMEGQMIGFGAGIPNVNEITINFKKGRILPFNIFRLLFGKKKTKVIRIILLGVLEEHRNLGIAAVFFANFIQSARDFGLEGGEASWVLESNTEMCNAAENLNGQKYKTYRILSKKV